MKGRGREGLEPGGGRGRGNVGCGGGSVLERAYLRAEGGS